MYLFLADGSFQLLDGDKIAILVRLHLIISLHKFNMLCRLLDSLQKD